MKKLYVVGDIHGCYDSLIGLLNEIHYDIQENKFDDVDIVFLGDYIDRGPDSRRVLEHLIDLDESSNETKRFHFLRGNHEDFAIEYNGKNHQNWAYNGGTQTLDGYDKKIMSPEHVDWIKKTELMVRVGDIVCVHACINPEYLLIDQDEFVMLWSRKFDDYNGDYDENVLVIRGHTPTVNVVFLKNQINIDTAAVFGGKLTAIRLDVEKRKFEQLIQVKGLIK